MQTISRLYANEEYARKAWDELKRRGFADTHIFTPPPRSDDEAPAPARTAEILEAMVQAYIFRSDAAILAKHVSNGSSVVTVHAPFSGGLKATSVLDRHGPIESGLPEPTFPSYAWDETHPLSSALRLPLLTKCALPFEYVFGLPTLMKARQRSSEPIGPDRPAPFSAALGLQVLSDNPAPFSSRFGIPVLLKSGPLFYK
jgi:hypothetical protein